MQNTDIFDLQRKSIVIEARNYIESVIKNKISIDSLEEVEFQVFSQFGEDGIIQWIISRMPIKNRVFVEFGVEDYFESNTRFLLNNNNWSGVVLDGDENNINRLKKSKYYWRYDLTAISAFITTENINDLIRGAGVHGEIGILSVDIDGNDYWVLKAIDVVDPQIVICEYNGVFGGEKRVTIPYKEDFYRTEAHYSNLYWGASISAFRKVLEDKGYLFLGSNSAGNNAFFVKKDDFPVESIPKRRNEFVESKYRESRDENGELTFLRGKERLNEIRDMVLVDLDTMEEKTISDIYSLKP